MPMRKSPLEHRYHKMHRIPLNPSCLMQLCPKQYCVGALNSCYCFNHDFSLLNELLQTNTIRIKQDMRRMLIVLDVTLCLQEMVLCKAKLLSGDLKCSYDRTSYN